VNDKTNVGRNDKLRNIMNVFYIILLKYSETEKKKQISPIRTAEIESKKR